MLTGKLSRASAAQAAAALGSRRLPRSAGPCRHSATHLAPRTGASSASPPPPFLHIRLPAAPPATAPSRLSEASASGVAAAAAAAAAATAMKEGRLVPDAVVLGLVQRRLRAPDCAHAAWVLDGVPRTAAQASALLAAAETRPQAVVRLDVPVEAIRARLAHRRRDPVTGAVYNLKTQPPRDAGVLARLEVRADDRGGVVDRRLRAYQAEEGAVWAAFEEGGVPVVRVQAKERDGVEEVWRRVRQVVCGLERVVLAGAPGCGKGTQGVRMAEVMGGVHVSTGDLLREVVMQGGEAVGRQSGRL